MIPNLLNIVFDLDGTIINNGEPLCERKVHEIKDLSAKSNLLFASARPVRDMLPLIPEPLRSSTFIGCNGGQAWKQGELIFSDRFDKHDVLQVILYLQSRLVPYILDGDWGYSLSPRTHPFHEYIQTLSNDLKSEDEIMSLGVTKVLVLDMSIKQEVEALLKSSHLQFSVHPHSSENMFDLTPNDTNKAKALSKLDVDFNRTVAVGNDHNDFSMLDSSRVAVFVEGRSVYRNADHLCSFDEVIPLVRDILGSK
ncbi:Cof-type HAD-IIB family hydrolase [Vibrio profundum]|uniref:HAD-IIB family hydrolase n=1 Tax=Vibrio profundum TaxID=2910247 RepID=UPI003D0FC690